MFKISLINIKKNIFSFMFFMFTLFLIIFSKSNLLAAKSGLNIFLNSIIPSLFPFFVATELLSHTNFPQLMGFYLKKIMYPLFNIKGEGSFALIMGIISGYPMGAKIACNFRLNNICSKEECERLLSFTNNSGPLFIFGTVGITMFGNSSIGFLLLFTHILSSFTVGFIFRNWKKNKKTFFKNKEIIVNKLDNNLKISDLGQIISESINKSISTTMTIGGFIILFSVIISIIQNSKALIIFEKIFTILNIPPDIGNSFILGLIEITNGISIISSIPLKKISINIIVISFLLGFGGISVFLQVWSFVSKTDLSIKPYILGKLLHGLIAAFYTATLINLFPWFNFDI